MNTPSTDQLQRLPKWAQDYIAWLRSELARVEYDAKRLEAAEEEARSLRLDLQTAKDNFAELRREREEL